VELNIIIKSNMRTYKWRVLRAAIFHFQHVSDTVFIGFHIKVVEGELNIITDIYGDGPHTVGVYRILAWVSW